MFIDPINLVTTALQMSGQNSVQASMFLGFLPTLGLNGFRGVGGSMDLATGDFDSESRTFMFVDQPASGVMGLFQFPAADLAPPEWVPACSPCGRWGRPRPGGEPLRLEFSSSD